MKLSSLLVILGSAQAFHLAARPALGSPRATVRASENPLANFFGGKKKKQESALTKGLDEALKDVTTQGLEPVTHASTVT